MTSLIPAIASLVFACGYFVIIFEAKLKISKAAVALAMGGVMWILLSLFSPALVETEIIHTGAEIFNLVVFLLAAMSLVEIAGHYRLFDFIREKLCSYHLSTKAQFFMILGITFILSATLDNLTTTIVMIQIARKFFWKDNLIAVAAGVVIAANAGGAFSPIGDVTTIMLWLADTFTAFQIISFGFLPSVACLLVSSLLIARNIQIEETIQTNTAACGVNMCRSEKIVIGFVAVSFLLPILVKSVHLPPVLGILLGLGLTWICVDFFKTTRPSETHLSASIEHLIQKSDLGSIKFFVGILLAVSALGSLGVLGHVSEVLYGEHPDSFMRIASANVLLGVVSAVLDNIPLTAIAIKILTVTDYHLWVLLALSVGMGGSLLSLGSAAGVVAMGMVKELTFARYFTLAFVPALLGFCAAVTVWWVQYLFVG